MNAPKKVLLQNRESQLYYRAGGTWTSHHDQAENFEHAANAMEFARIYKLPNLDVLLNFGDPKHDIRVPVQA